MTAVTLVSLSATGTLVSSQVEVTEEGDASVRSGGIDYFLKQKLSLQDATVLMYGLKIPSYKAVDALPLLHPPYDDPILYGPHLVVVVNADGAIVPLDRVSDLFNVCPRSRGKKPVSCAVSQFGNSSSMGDPEDLEQCSEGDESDASEFDLGKETESEGSDDIKEDQEGLVDIELLGEPDEPYTTKNL